MMSRKRQGGATLIISLIMLMAITLVVVYALRASNTNLRIAGNMQYQAEAFAATEVVIEQTIELVKATDMISSIPAQTIPVTLNGLQYSVARAPMGSCKMEVPVLTTELSYKVPADVPCFESADRGDLPITAGGAVSATQSTCKNQLWEVGASVTEPMSGAKVEQVQGMTIRVPSIVKCS